MGRLHHLRQTLPINLAQNSSPEIEFVLLDYHSPDGLGAWIQQRFAREIAAGRLVYYRTEEPRYYHSAHAKNVVHRLARGDILCNLDADNYLVAGFSNFLLGLFQQEPNSVTRGAEVSGFVGRVALTKAAFLRLRGYDETFIGYGYDDRDFVARAVASGMALTVLPAKFARLIGHSRAERLARMPPQLSYGSDRNRVLSQASLAAGRLIANAGRPWGVAIVEKNFSNKLVFQTP